MLGLSFSWFWLVFSIICWFFFSFSSLVLSVIRYGRFLLWVRMVMWEVVLFLVMYRLVVLVFISGVRLEGVIFWVVMMVLVGICNGVVLLSSICSMCFFRLCRLLVCLVSSRLFSVWRILYWVWIVWC